MIRRILALRPRALGDVVLTTPALRALARGHRGATLDVVTERPYAPLLAGLPEVTRVWTLERSTRATLALGLQLRRERYDLVVDFFGNPRTALLSRVSGAPRRAGYDLRGRRGAYTLRVARSVHPELGEREYAAAVHVRLAIAAGGIDDGLETRVALGDAARTAAAGLLAAAGVLDPARTIGLIAAGTWATKTWPWSHAASLARGLMNAGWEVLALVGPGESAVAATLDRLAPGVRVLPSCGVAELAAVIARLSAVAGTDSGPRHLAAALGVPSFAWFGPTHPDTWSPPDPRHGFWWTSLPCRGCDRTACPHWNCMPSLAPARAAQLVLDHLDRLRARAGLGVLADARPTADLRTPAGA